MTYPAGPLRGRLSGRKGMTGRLSIGTADPAPAYDGPYEFTPTDTAQVVLIEGKTATEDIIFGAIPSNYGRIVWNGAVMTIL